MPTKAQKTKVGIFLISGLVLIVLVFLAVSGIRHEPVDYFNIRFTESVSGLGAGSTVTYKGVPVGQVEDIRVTDRNEIISKISVKRKRVRLREGTVATLDLAGITGQMRVELSGGDPKKGLLRENTFIPEKPSLLAGLYREMPLILEEIRTILSKLDAAIGEVKGGQLGELVRDTKTMVNKASVTLEGGDRLLRTTRASILNMEGEMAQTMRSLKETVLAAQRVFNYLSIDPESIWRGKVKPRHPYIN